MSNRIAAFAAALALACPAYATLTSTTNTVSYTGNAVTTSFTVPFKFLTSTDLVVTVAGLPRTLNVHYTVTGAGNATGTVKFITAPASLASVVITRVVPFTQTSTVRQSLPFPAGAAIDAALDKLAMGEQQLQALYTNPPATVLPANVTAKLNGIRFADQFANIQAAITDAGTTGSVLIPSSYAGTDSFTNPNGIPILDLRGGPAALRGFISVKDYGAKGDGVANDTTAVTAAIATGRRVYFPTGVYLITSSIVGQGAWLGDGPGNVFDSNSGPGTTIIRCSGANGGVPFVTPPPEVQGIHFDGIDKSGNGLVMGADNGTFSAFRKWRNVTVRNFNIAIHAYNFFAVVWDNLVIQGNHEGIRIDPTVTTPDGGYFTSTAWRNLYIADNDVLGLIVNTPQGAKTWTMENIIVERNGSAGTYQASVTSADFEARGLYVEGSPTKVGLKVSNLSMSITNGYFNGSGGIDFSSAAVKADFWHLFMTSASDAFAGLSALTHMRVLGGSILQSDPRLTIGGRAIVEQSTVAGASISRQTTTVFTDATYGATVTIDLKLGNIFRVTATNATPFTISNPTGGTQGQQITICISNTSGGALGAVTWGAQYKMSAWTSPATGFQRCAQFVSSSSSNFIGAFQSAADIPN